MKIFKENFPGVPHIAMKQKVYIYFGKGQTLEALEDLVRLLSNPTMQSNINSLGVEGWKFENEK